MHFITFGLFVVCMMVFLPGWMLASWISRKRKKRAERQLKEKQDMLVTILRIARETFRDGKGISLRQALYQTDYRNVRSRFSPQDLVPLIQSNSDFINDWLTYSADKQTSSGYYIKETGEIGQVHSLEKINFSPIETAVAEYIVKELDYWTNL